MSLVYQLISSLGNDVSPENNPNNKWYFKLKPHAKVKGTVDWAESIKYYYIKHIEIGSNVIVPMSADNKKTKYFTAEFLGFEDVSNEEYPKNPILKIDGKEFIMEHNHLWAIDMNELTLFRSKGAREYNHMELKKDWQWKTFPY